MAKVSITIESNWDDLTIEQQDYLCLVYAQAIIKFSLEKINKEDQPDKTT